MTLLTPTGNSPIKLGEAGVNVSLFVPVPSLNTRVGGGKLVSRPGGTESVKLNDCSTRPFVAIVFLQMIEPPPNKPSVPSTASPDGSGCVTVARRGIAKGFTT